ncbi:DUF4214 domain-containing protein [Massilia sp. ST3]|uniref:DUF4214 domain-containing protein n=1 Tax=Massilia sp. ST3 TaxID=2824903 RepID=UPI001B843F89|nr:DUF4214 domain-containing protein [Massilia sp. ST3]MBQ5948900.1 DUF4214 domain-containing protein [Massilia sp. ST3]
MATVSEVLNTPLSGMTHIDALLDKGPDWNYLTSSTNVNTIYYTFSISSGNEEGRSGQEAFSAVQQTAARGAFGYLQQLTGISFVETGSGTSAQIHLANVNLEDSRTTGLCSWTSPYSYTGSTLSSYDADAWVYLDNAEWRAQNQNLAPGGEGYETLLHELGHALGLKHPFEAEPENGAVLSASEDNTSNTLLSYDSAGGPYSAYSPYDIAALNWLYGGDGLRGALGINSMSGARYLTGTNRADTLTGTRNNDTLQGNGGNDMINGGEGTDTVVFSGVRSNYTLANQADGSLLATSSAEGTDTLRSVEVLKFADMTVQRSDLVDTTAPGAPVFLVTANQFNYARGSKPEMQGSAEAGSTVKIYAGATQIASTVVDASGIWKVESSVVFPDGLNYSVTATATDAAGNVSAASAPVSFNIDATPPTNPTGSFTLAAGSNQPAFTGTGEVGTVVHLYRVADTIQEFGAVTVGADGRWTINSAALPNGAYQVAVAATDKAGNAASAAAYLPMTISNALNQTGTAGKDVFTMGDGSSAVSGGAGIDVAVFSGSRAGYTVSKAAWGSLVSDKSVVGGTDRLVDVERIQFSDGWKAIDVDGIGGQVFRLYQAVFGRPADTGGQGFYMYQMEQGMQLVQVADAMMRVPAPDGQIEFDKLYGVNPTNEVFITKLYNNVLDRNPDAGGYAFWLDKIEDLGRARVLMEFSESPENKGNVIDVIGQGIDYTPFGNT